MNLHGEMQQASSVNSRVGMCSMHSLDNIVYCCFAKQKVANVAMVAYVSRV